MPSNYLFARCVSDVHKPWLQYKCTIAFNLLFSFFFFLFQFHEIVEKRSKEQECVTTSINSRITSICRLMSTSISIPIVDYAFITAYRAFPVSCSSFSSIIFLVHAFSIIVDYREKIPVSLASLFLVSSFPSLPLLSAIFLYLLPPSPACPSTTSLLLFLLQSTGGYFIFPFLSDCLTFSFCSFVSSINVPFYALFPPFSAFESKQMELPSAYNGIK